MEYRLELVPVPVADVDRAKAFYTEKIGFEEDLDHRAGDEFRVVQLTPPGSACSIAVGISSCHSNPQLGAPSRWASRHLESTRVVGARGEAPPVLRPAADPGGKGSLR